MAVINPGKHLRRGYNLTSKLFDKKCLKMSVLNEAKPNLT